MKLFRIVQGSRRRETDAGFTLVEVVVASTIGIILGGLVLSVILVGHRSADNTVSAAHLDGEARVLLNRLAGDLRQATPLFTTVDPATGTKVETPAITNVENPEPYGTAGQLTSLTFNADFSGNGCVEDQLSDNCPSPAPSLDPDAPEIETFCWDPSGGVVYLIAGPVNPGSCTPSTAGITAKPLLSGNVVDMKIYCYSNRYAYDGAYDHTHDGVTDWRELDAAGSPIGNGNNKLDGNELDYVNSVRISVTIADGDHSQTDQTLVFVRNVP